MTSPINWKTTPELALFFPEESREHLADLSEVELHELIQKHLKDKLTEESKITELYISIISNHADPLNLIKLLLQNKIVPQTTSSQTEILALSKEKKLDPLLKLLMVHGFTINEEEIKEKNRRIHYFSPAYAEFEKYRKLLQEPFQLYHSFYQTVFGSPPPSLNSFSANKLDPQLFFFLAQHVDTESQIRDNPDFARTLSTLLTDYIPDKVTLTHYSPEQLELWLLLAKYQPELASENSLVSIIKYGVRETDRQRSFLTYLIPIEKLSQPDAKAELLSQIKGLSYSQLNENNAELLTTLLAKLHLSPEENLSLFKHGLKQGIPLLIRFCVTHGIDPTAEIEETPPLSIALECERNEVCEALLKSAPQAQWDRPKHGQLLEKLRQNPSKKSLVELSLAHGIGATYLNATGQSIFSQLVQAKEWSLVNRLFRQPIYRQALQTSLIHEADLERIVREAPLETIQQALNCLRVPNLAQILERIPVSQQQSSRRPASQIAHSMLLASALAKQGCTPEQILKYFQATGKSSLNIQLIKIACDSHKPLNESLNEKIIAHVLGNAFVREKRSASGENLEGAQFHESLSFLTQVLNEIEAKEPKQYAALTPLIAQLERARDFDLIRLALAHTASSRPPRMTSPEEFIVKTMQELYDQFQNSITHLSEGETFLLPTGYINPDDHNHAMLLAITKQANNCLHIKLINTGDGLAYNLKSFVGTKEKVYPIVEFDQVPSEKLLDRTFMTALFEPITQSLVFKNRANPNYRAEDLYFSILRELKEFQISSTPLADDFITPQHAGICTMKSALAYLRIVLGKQSYKTLKKEIQTRTLALAEARHGQDHVIDNLIDDAKSNLARLILKRINANDLNIGPVSAIKEQLTSLSPASLAAKNPDFEWQSHDALENSEQATAAIQKHVTEIRSAAEQPTETVQKPIIVKEFYKKHSAISIGLEIKAALAAMATALKEMDSREELKSNHTLAVTHALNLLHALPLPNSTSDPYATMNKEERKECLEQLITLSIQLTRLGQNVPFADCVLGHYFALAIAYHLISLDEKEHPPTTHLLLSSFIPNYTTLQELQKDRVNHAYHPQLELKLEQLVQFFKERDRNPAQPKFFDPRKRVADIPAESSAEYLFFSSLNIPEQRLEGSIEDYRQLDNNFKNKVKLREYQMATVWGDSLKRPLFSDYVPKSYLQLQTIALAANEVGRMDPILRTSLSSDTELFKPELTLRKDYWTKAVNVKLNGLFFLSQGALSSSKTSYADNIKPHYFDLTSFKYDNQDNQRKISEKTDRAAFIDTAVKPSLYFHRLIDLFSGPAFKTLPERNVQAYVEHLLFYHGTLRDAFNENPDNIARIKQLLKAIEEDASFHIEQQRPQVTENPEAAKKLEAYQQLRLFTLKVRRRILEYSQTSGLITPSDYVAELSDIRKELKGYLNDSETIQYNALAIWITTYQYVDTLSLAEAEELFTSLHRFHQMAETFSEETLKRLSDPQLQHELELTREQIATLAVDLPGLSELINPLLNQLVFPGQWKGHFPTYSTTDAEGRAFARYSILSGELALDKTSLLSKESLKDLEVWKEYFKEANPQLRISYDTKNQTSAYVTVAKDGHPVTLSVRHLEKTKELVLEKMFDNRPYHYLSKSQLENLVLPAIPDREKMDVWCSSDQKGLQILFTDQSTGQLLWSFDLESQLLRNRAQTESSEYRWVQLKKSENALTQFLPPSQWLAVSNNETGKYELHASLLRDPQNQPLKFISEYRQLKDGSEVEKLVWSENPTFHVAQTHLIQGLQAFKEFLVLEDDSGAQKVILPVKAWHASKPQSTCPYIVVDLNAHRYPTSKQTSHNLYLSYLYAQHGQYTTAMHYLKLAEPLQPYTAEEFKLLGWLFTAGAEMRDNHPDAIALRAYAGYLGSLEGGLLQNEASIVGQSKEQLPSVSSADYTAGQWKSFWSGQFRWNNKWVAEAVASSYHDYLGLSGNVSKPLHLHAASRPPFSIQNPQWQRRINEAQQTGLNTREMIQHLKEASQDPALSDSDKKHIGLSLIGFLDVEELNDIPIGEFGGIQLEPLKTILKAMSQEVRPDRILTDSLIDQAILSFKQFYSLIIQLKAPPYREAFISPNEESIWLTSLIKQHPLPTLMSRKLQLHGFHLPNMDAEAEPPSPQPKITDTSLFMKSSANRLSLSEALSKISPLTRPKEALKSHFFSLVDLALNASPKEFKRVLMFSAHDPDPECQAMRTLLLAFIDKEEQSKQLSELLRQAKQKGDYRSCISELNKYFEKLPRKSANFPNVTLARLPLLIPQKEPEQQFTITGRRHALPGASSFESQPKSGYTAHPSFPEAHSSSKYLRQHMQKIKQDYHAGCSQLESSTHYTLNSLDEARAITFECRTLLPELDSELARLETQILEMANALPEKAIEGFKAYLALKGKQETPVTLFEAISLYALNNPSLFKKRLATQEQSQIAQLNQALFDYLTTYMNKQRLSKALEFLEKANASTDKKAMGIRWQKQINQAGALLTYEPPYDAALHPQLLAFEAMMSQEKGLFLLRPDQIEDLKSMTGGSEAPYPPQALQRIMGAGKTIVLGAILARMKADGKHLSLFIPPKELFETNAQDLKWLVKQLFGQNTKTIRFDRGTEHVTLGYLSSIYVTLNEAINKRKLVVVSPKTLFNLHNKYIELLEEVRMLKSAQAQPELIRPIQEKVELLGKILSLMREKGIATIDEVDSAIAPFREFNFPVEQREPLDMDAVNVIGRVMTLAATDPELIAAGLDLQSNQQSLMSKETYQTNIKPILIEKVVHELQRDRSLAKLLRVDPSDLEKWTQLTLYWKGGSPLPAFVDELALSGNLKDAEAAELMIMLYKQFDSWLTDAWSSSANEQYGRSHIDVKRGISIPYTSAQTPDENSELAMPVDMINKTFQWYLSEGLSLDQMQTFLQESLQKAYTEWLASGRNGTLNDTPTALHLQRLLAPFPLDLLKLSADKPEDIAFFQHMLTVGKPNLENLKLRLNYYAHWLESNPEQRIDFETKFQQQYGCSFSEAQTLAKGEEETQALKLAQTLLRYTPEQVKTVYDFLIPEVFSKETTWSSQIFSTPQTLVSLFKVCQGYSGTIENRYLYPIDWKVRLDKGANGRIIEKILSANRTVLHAPAVTAEKMVSIVAQDPNRYNALIDVGALCKDRNDFEMAQLLIHALDTQENSKIKGVLYFDSTTNYLCCLKKGAQSIVLPSTDPKVILQITGLTPEHLFTYYGHSRTKGFNILQDKHARALLTIGEHTTLSDQLQGTMRMRQFLKKQPIDYFYPDELRPSMGELNRNDAKAYLHEDPTIDDLLLFTGYKEGKRQPMLTLQALIQRMENSVCNLALVHMLQAPSADERDALFAKCRELYIRPTAIKMYAQYAKEHPIVPIGEFLKALRQRHLDLIQTTFPEADTLSSAVEMTLDKEIDRALRKKILPELVPMDFDLGRAKERTVEQQHARAQVQAQQNVLLNEVQLLQDTVVSEKKAGTFLNWPEKLSLDAIEPSVFESSSLLWSYEKEAHFYALPDVMQQSNALKPFSGCISEGIMVTENAITTLENEINILLHDHKTNFEQLLFKDRNGAWKLILLTTQEADSLKIKMKQNPEAYQNRACLFDRAGYPVLDYLNGTWQRESAAVQLIFEGILLNGRLDILRRETWQPYIRTFAERSGEKGSTFVEHILVNKENWGAYQHSFLQEVLQQQVPFASSTSLSEDIAIALGTKNEFVLTSLVAKLLKRNKKRLQKNETFEPFNPQDLMNLYRATLHNRELAGDVRRLITHELEYTFKEDRFDAFFACVKQFNEQSKNRFYDHEITLTIIQLLGDFRKIAPWKEEYALVTQSFYFELLNRACAVYRKNKESAVQILDHALDLAPVLRKLYDKQAVALDTYKHLEKLNRVESNNPLLLYQQLLLIEQSSATTPKKRKLVAALAQTCLNELYKRHIGYNAGIDDYDRLKIDERLNELQELSTLYKDDKAVQMLLQQVGLNAAYCFVYMSAAGRNCRILRKGYLTDLQDHFRGWRGEFIDDFMKKLNSMELPEEMTYEAIKNPKLEHLRASIGKL